VTTPQPGTVSSGTMRDQDLIPRFLEVLDEHAPSKAKELLDLYQNTLEHLDDESDSDEMARAMLLADLFEALNEIAPEDTYFGASEGDGADYGFWPEPDEDGF
jgi:hypothetical protein